MQGLFNNNNSVKIIRDHAGVVTRRFFTFATGHSRCFGACVHRQWLLANCSKGQLVTYLKTAYTAYAQNACDYQVLDSTFCRFDCDCFIHSMHSSTVPFGCASCHFSTRCCCNNKQVLSSFFRVKKPDLEKGTES